MGHMSPKTNKKMGCFFPTVRKRRCLCTAVQATDHAIDALVEVVVVEQTGTSSVTTAANMATGQITVTNPGREGEKAGVDRRETTDD